MLPNLPGRAFSAVPHDRLLVAEMFLATWRTWFGLPRRFARDRRGGVFMLLGFMLIPLLANVVTGLPNRNGCGVAFGRQRKIGDRLTERQLGFGKADKLTRLHRGHCNA